MIRQVQRGRVVLLAVTLLVVLWLSLGSAAAQQQPSAAPGQKEPDATAVLLDRTGRTVASVEFRQVARDVLVRLTPADPPRLTGAHALEIHAVAACQPFDFASAGALFNPPATAPGGGGPALGRLPNINYTTGLSAYQASLHGASLLRGVPNSLIGGQGTAMVMFDKPNDVASPTAGNPSERIACGAIRPSQGTATGQSALPNQVAQPVTLAQAVPAAGQPTATPTPARLTPSATPIRAAPAVVVQPSAPGTALGASTLKGPDASATLRDRSGRTLATVELRQVNRDVRLSVTFADPPRLTGTHGIQIHAVDACDLPDFASAGPLFNPTNKAHGSSSPGGPALGDLPNINYTTGLSTYQANIRGASLLRGVPNSLIGGFGTASRGTSVVLFDKADDGKTQPEGNAGDRIACGVIRPAQAAVAAVAGTATPTRSALTPTATPTRSALSPTATPTRAVAGAVAGQPTPTPTRPVAGAVAGQPTATPTRPVAGAIAGQPTATPTRPVAGAVAGQPTATPTRPVAGAVAGQPTATPTRPVAGAVAGQPTATPTPTRPVAGAVAGQPTPTPTRPVAGAIAGQPTATPTRPVAGAIAGQPTATPTRSATGFTATPTPVRLTPSATATRPVVTNAQLGVAQPAIAQVGATPTRTPTPVANPVGRVGAPQPVTAAVANIPASTDQFAARNLPVATPVATRGVNATPVAPNAAAVVAPNSVPTPIAGQRANAAAFGARNSVPTPIAGQPANAAAFGARNSVPTPIAGLPANAAAAGAPNSVPTPIAGRPVVAATVAPGATGGQSTNLGPLVGVLGLLLIALGYAVPRLRRWASPELKTQRQVGGL